MNINIKKSFFIHKKIRCKQIEIEADKFDIYLANAIWAKNFEIKSVKKYIGKWDVKIILSNCMFYLYCPRIFISGCDYLNNKHDKKCSDYRAFLNKGEYLPQITYNLFRMDK